MAAAGEWPQVGEPPHQGLAQAREIGRVQERSGNPMQADDVGLRHQAPPRPAIGEPHRREHVAPAVGIGVERMGIEPGRERREEPAADRGPGGDDVGIAPELASGMKRRGDAEVAQGAVQAERRLVGAAAAIRLCEMEDPHGPGCCAPCGCRLRRGGLHWCGRIDCGLVPGGWSAIASLAKVGYQTRHEV